MGNYLEKITAMISERAPSWIRGGVDEAMKKLVGSGIIAIAVALYAWGNARDPNSAAKTKTSQGQNELQCLKKKDAETNRNAADLTVAKTARDRCAAGRPVTASVVIDECARELWVFDKLEREAVQIRNRLCMR